MEKMTVHGGMHMKRGLVLSGGGSRGAYEIGAWQALEENGVRFDAVYGTSIGALNAGLVAQGDLDTAVELWSNILLNQVIATDDEDFSVDRMIHRKRDVIPFILENAKNLRMDITPLENMLARHLDEKRVRVSGMDLGVMVVRVPQLTPVPMKLADMAEGSLNDWLLASASCFPVFPLRKIDGDRYLDGGYFDNLPIDMAIADGMDEIVAVDIHPQLTHPEYTRMPFLKTISPLRNLGNFLDFSPEFLRRSRLMGYYDGMKAYGRFDGVRYTFIYRSEIQVAAQARRFMRLVAAFDAEAITRNAFRSSQPMDAPLISAIERETPLRALSWKEVWVRGLELCAQAMGFREDAVYDPDILAKRMLDFARRGEAVSGMDERGIAAAARMGRRELVSYIYRVLQHMGELPADYVRQLSEYPDEVAGALWLSQAN